MNRYRTNPLRFLSLALTCLALGMGACKKDETGGLDLNADVRIHGFSIAGTEASLSDTSRTIRIALPYGTRLESLSPTIALAPGATVDPASGAAVDLGNPISYTVTNGNIYSVYTVRATVLPAIQAFVINGDSGVVNESARTITVSVPKNTDVTSLAPAITMAGGISIAPASGQAQDFTNPVAYTVTAGSLQVQYTVYVVREGSGIAFLGTGATRADIVNLDEKAAADWLFGQFPGASYLSFADIQNNRVDLKQFGVIWWHYDAAQALPAVSGDATVLNALKAYRENGGSFLLTTWASQYVTGLGIVPPGKGPNNVFGDAIPFQGGSSDWGISFKGYDSHPLFAGLTRTSSVAYPAAYLLDKNSWRLNHVGWWKVNDWGNYGNAAGWRTQTGGLDLASEISDENHNSNVAVAEFPKTADHGPAIVITIGGYDWYNENDPNTGGASPANSFKANIERMTLNAINYLNE